METTVLCLYFIQSRGSNTGSSNNFCRTWNRNMETLFFIVKFAGLVVKGKVLKRFYKLRKDVQTFVDHTNQAFER